MKQILIILLTILLTLNSLFGQTNKENATTQQIDALINELFPTNDRPGTTVLVAKKGEIIYQKALGKANLELDVDMKLDHIFRIASNTKPFTACAILKLAEEGKLSVKDDITKYIEDYPTHGHTITIEHLLTHTSGIKNFTSIDNFSKIEGNDYTTIEFIEFFKNEPMDFAPGTRFNYSNSAYFLLGYIIEKVSNKSYATYLEDVFFKPLDMKNTFYDNPRAVIKNRTTGYVPNGHPHYLNGKHISMTIPYAAGSLLSSVKDLYTFYDALMKYKIIGKESLDKAHTPYKLNNGELNVSGYSWFIGDILGSPMIFHDGGITGYYSSLVFFPEEQVFVVALTNCNWQSFNFNSLSRKIASIVIDKAYVSTDNLPEDKLNAYEAVYETESGEQKVISVQEEKLFVNRKNGSLTLVFHFKNDTFFAEEASETLEFIRDNGGKVISVISTRRGSPITFNRTMKALPKKILYIALRQRMFDNVDDGIEYYKYLKKSNYDKYNFSNIWELDHLGYDLLVKNRLEDAIKVYNLLVSEFPNHPMSFASLGEAHFQNGNYKLALQNYQKSLDLDPENNKTKDSITKIKSLASSGD